MPGHNGAAGRTVTEAPSLFPLPDPAAPRARTSADAEVQPVGERLRALLDEDLGFHGRRASSGRHRWHPFPAKFPPALPRRFIKVLSRPGETVLDPMAGSGTTLVEAQSLGRRAIGCDIDPLARRIALAKLAPPDPGAAAEAGRDVLALAGARLRSDAAGLTRDLDRRFDAATRKFVDYWFRPAQQLELEALAAAISGVREPRTRRFLEVVVSSAIIAKSGGVSLARDLAHTRPHRIEAKQPKPALAVFEGRLRRIVRSRSAPAGDDAPTARVLDAPATDTGLPSGSVDLVVTSPPYANGAIDYMRAHKFSLVWLGWPLADLTRLRRRYVGHDAVLGGGRSGLPDRCERTLAQLAEVDRRKAAVLRRYFGDMAAVLRETERVLRPGGAAIVVVGTSVLRGLDVETHLALAALAEETGFEVAGIGRRRLDRDRRMMPARWGAATRSGIEHRMHEEFVLGLLRR